LKISKAYYEVLCQNLEKNPIPANITFLISFLFFNWNMIGNFNRGGSGENLSKSRSFGKELHNAYGIEAYHGIISGFSLN